MPVENEIISVAEDGEEEEELGGWIVTFADMSMLLLTFFIMLFSMSTIDTSRFTDSFTSVRNALGTGKERPDTVRIQKEDGAILDSVRLQRQIIEAQRKVYAEVRTYMNSKGLEGVVGSIFDQGIITLKVPTQTLFEKDKVGLTPEGRTLLMHLREVFIQRRDQVINIRGYTDNQPPSPESRFKDNWEVSSLRAVNVLRFFLDQGIEPTRLTATGLADLDPVVPNDTEDNRARNRRVEFVLEKRIGEQ